MVKLFVKTELMVQSRPFGLNQKRGIEPTSDYKSVLAGNKN